MKNKIVRVVVIFVCLFLLVCPMFSVSAFTFPGTVTFNNVFNVPHNEVYFRSALINSAIKENTVISEFGTYNVLNRNSNLWFSVVTDYDNVEGYGYGARFLIQGNAPDYINKGLTNEFLLCVFYDSLNMPDGVYQADLLFAIDVYSDTNDVYFDSGANCAYGVGFNNTTFLLPCPFLIVYDNADSLIFSLDDGIYDSIINTINAESSLTIDYSLFSDTQYIISLRQAYTIELEDEAYNQGLLDGTQQGYNDGYNTGYNKGSSEVFGENLLGQSFNAPLDALNQWVLFETPGGVEVTMGSLFTAVIALAVLIIFLKMFAGG